MLLLLALHLVNVDVSLCYVGESLRSLQFQLRLGHSTLSDIIT
jgi:hypothetical protein